MPPAARPVLAPRDANATTTPHKRRADNDDDNDAAAAKKSRLGPPSLEQEQQSPPPLSADKAESASRRLTRRKIELLRLRLALAKYKVRTGQESLPLERLENLPLPCSKPPSLLSAWPQADAAHGPPSQDDAAPSLQASPDKNAAASQQLLTHSHGLQPSVLQGSLNPSSSQDNLELLQQKDDAPNKLPIPLQHASLDTWQQNAPSSGLSHTASSAHQDSCPSPLQSGFHCSQQSPSSHPHPSDAQSASTEPCSLPSLLQSHESPSSRGGAATSLLWLARGGDT
ncbi:hypothetical protein CDD82_4133 [Ophiocordyceps australis]|uniref:Uncharacterized protein n=1 Tax=Ophiocordyceps australis TaxID=1399860 RepID=A0A2C5Z8K3_9HYPO|nr:hypothetical protein CDD82_4133 [Ophiocordyceps australis]